MQVLLRKDDKRLGRIGDMVEVKPGYARNCLLPQGIAVPLTQGNRRRVEILKRRAEEEQRLQEQERVALSESLNGVSITITARANEEGHLFGSVNAAQIAEVLQNEGYKIEEKMIRLAEPIKEVGVVDVPVQVTSKLVSVCKVWIVAE